MKKLIVALMVLGLVFAFVSSPQASSTRTIPIKGKTLTSDLDDTQLFSSQGVTVYKITGYATAANATFALFNSSSIQDCNDGTTSASIEGGEADSGDAIIMYDFGDPNKAESGLNFDNGLVVMATGCNISILYR